MFGSMQPSPYDLNFYVGRVPVRVMPFFWLIGLFLGANVFDGTGLGMVRLALFIIALFLSILVHELGHAWTVMRFGWHLHEVVLHGFGGVALYQPGSRYTMGRRILVALAGPFAGFVLAGIVFGMFYGFRQAGRVPPEPVLYLGTYLLWINIVFGILNLLPILPLDGGRVLEAVLTRFRSHQGTVLAYRISAVLCGLAIAFILLNQGQVIGIGQFRIGLSMYDALLFGILLFTNLQALQHYRYR